MGTCKSLSMRVYKLKQTLSLVVERWLLLYRLLGLKLQIAKVIDRLPDLENINWIKEIASD